MKGDSRITALLYDDVYVVKDALYNMVSEKDESSAIYIYQVEDWTKSYQVYDKYEEKYKEEESSLLLSKSHIYESEKSAYGTLLFLTTFIGVIFFVASGSFIYNKFYMDEEAD